MYLYYIICRRKLGESKLKFNKVQRTLYRLRDKKYPKHPKTHQEIKQVMSNPKVSQDFGRTMDNANQFYFGSVVNKLFAFHVFASLAVINMIKDKIRDCDRSFLIDGTFKMVPRMCAQLLIISIQYKNNVCQYFLHFMCMCIL